MIRRTVLLLLCLAALAACSPHRTPVRPPMPQGTLAVAAFTNPIFNWELLAGYLPQEGRRIDPKVLAGLDDALTATLKAHRVTDYMQSAVARQCQEIVVFEGAGASRKAAFDYWIKVGRCIPADFLLVPQAMVWRELEGSDVNLTTASVMFDLFLIDVKNETILRRYHFDETQAPLSSNLLEMKKYMQRGGKWVQALDLAREGLGEGLTELGL